MLEIFKLYKSKWLITKHRMSANLRASQQRNLWDTTKFSTSNYSIQNCGQCQIVTAWHVLLSFYPLDSEADYNQSVSWTYLV